MTFKVKDGLSLGSTTILDASGNVTVPSKLTLSNATTAQSSLNIGAGSASPTSPLTGDLWYNAGALLVRQSAATKTIAYTDSTITGNAANVTGTVAIANGGTNGSAAPTNGGIPYGTGSAYAFSVAGSSGQVLMSNGAAAPSWITPTTANTASTIVYRDASGNFSAGTITASLTGNVTGNLTGNVTGNTSGTAGSISGFGNPATANTASTIVYRDASGNFSAGTITASLTGTATKSSNIVGGAAGSIPYQTAADTTSLLGVGGAGAILRSSGTAPAWTSYTFPSTASTGKILRGDGTNWVETSATYPTSTSANAILYSSAANTISEITSGNNGVLVTNGTGVPSISSTLPAIAIATSATTPIVYGSSAASGTLLLSSTSNGTKGTVTLGDDNAGTSTVRGAAINVKLGTAASAGFLKVAATTGAVTIDTNSYVTSVSGTAPIVSSGGTTPAISINAATTSAAGSMSAADKSKLDGIAANATNVTNTNQLTNGAGFITSASSISGNAATASLAYVVSSGDPDRTLATPLPNAVANSVRFQFANAGAAGTGGTYAGVMTYAPWLGTVASTGDASYQLAFGSTATNGSGIPMFNIRKGIDSTWNSWYTLIHSGNTDRTTWSSYGNAINLVSGQIAWKNFGNGHTIIDASAGTAPDGTAINNTNSANVWSATYPTLVGWNGSSTYGVRVDTSRYSDSSGAVAWANITGKPTVVTSVSGTAPITSTGGTTPAIGITAATTSAAGSMSAADKSKLDGIAAGATANLGTVTSVTGTAPVVSSGGTTPAISMAAATSTVNGYMTSTYAAKLDGIAAGATANTGTVTSVTGTAPISVATGTTTPAISMAAATSTVNGYMTSTYAAKLDGIAAGATNVTNTNQLTNGAGFITSSASISGNAATATTAAACSGNAATVTNGVYTNTNNTLTGIFGVARDSTSSDPYGPISVTRGTASNFSYYGLTRAGSIGWSIGIDTSNNIAFGTGATSAGIMTGLPLTCSSAGNLTAAGNVTAYSDARLKKDLEVITNATSKVQQLTGYTYTRIDSGARQTGIIAQDLQKVLPEAVINNGEYLSVAYGNLVGLLIESIKELKAEIDELKGNK